MFKNRVLTAAILAIFVFNLFDIQIVHAPLFGEITVPTNNSSPQVIVNATDGYMWFTEWNTNKIAKMDRQSVVA